tara:strand:+ start:74 stop:418 length:345 start_codon:yes stop_codon:yes gene_type:complete
MEKTSIFIDHMGDSPTIRVLDYLLTERELDFSISDLARNVKLGRSTIYRIWDRMLKNKVVIPSRTIGNAKLYKINKKNPLVEKLIEIDDMLIIKELDKSSKEQESTTLTTNQNA